MAFHETAALYEPFKAACDNNELDKAKGMLPKLKVRAYEQGESTTSCFPSLGC